MGTLKIAGATSQKSEERERPAVSPSAFLYVLQVLVLGSSVMIKRHVTGSMEVKESNLPWFYLVVILICQKEMHLFKRTK